MHFLVSSIKSKYPRFGAIVDGTQLTLMKNGEWQLEVMKGMRIDREDGDGRRPDKGSRIHLRRFLRDP